MASLLLRLEGSAVATAGGCSLLGRIFTGIFRSIKPFDSNNLGSCGHHRMMSTINSSPSKMSPRLMLPPAFEGRNMVYQLYNLAENRVESLNRRRSSSKEEELDVTTVGSSHGWLALFSRKSKILFLSNPVTRRHIKLPPYHTLLDPDEEGSFAVSKVILSCSPDEEECRAMMSFGFGFADRLAFCLPGKSSTHWTFIGKVEDGDKYRYYDDDDDDDDDEFEARGCGDTAYSARHKLFFCVTESNYLQAWDLQDPQSPRIELSDWIGELKGEHELQEILYRSEEQPEIKQQKYLVFDEKSNQLFLVRRHIMARVAHDGAYVRPFFFGYGRGWDQSYPYKTIGFDVHKIDWEKCGNTKVTYMEGSLDGLVMFVGLNHSFALPAAEFPGLIPNSIYFTDTMNDITPSERAREDPPRHPRWMVRIYGGHDIGIFSYENRTFSPCYYPCDVQSIKRITPPPIWLT